MSSFLLLLLAACGPKVVPPELSFEEPNVLGDSPDPDLAPGLGGLAAQDLPEADPTLAAQMASYDLTVCSVLLFDGPEVVRPCNRIYLQFAYGQPLVDGQPPWDLDEDPGYGHSLELTLGSARLEHMITGARASCDLVQEDLGASDDVECARAVEFYEGMLERKTSLYEDNNLGSFQPVLDKVLAGEALTRQDLFLDQELSWSRLTLQKLWVAVGVRHGGPVYSPEDEAFFYGPREAAGPLPLPRPDAPFGMVTPTDKANLALINEADRAAYDAEMAGPLPLDPPLVPLE